MTERAAGDGRSLVRVAIEVVTGHIRAHHLRAGDTLPAEQHFASSLGVSRAVIREAFGALAALRVVDVGNGRKPRVGALDGSVIAASLEHGISTAQITVADVWDVRRTIELRTAALAAAMRTLEEAQAIVSLAEAMAGAGDDLEALTRHDVAFHQAIARACRNPLFLQIVVSFAPLMEVAVPAAWRTRRTRKQRLAMLDRHRAVAGAIRDGDAAAAGAAMEGHFDASIGTLLTGAAGRGRARGR
jgi:GntR family transcriptional regulator, transcriptional repressor for pyruvate dehydrogenase complex